MSKRIHHALKHAGRTIRLRLRKQDEQIQRVLDELPEGERSEFIRDAIRQKIENGDTDTDAILKEIRDSLKSLTERQTE